MAANVETMMFVRERPWHGLGTEVSEAPNSEDALRFAGLENYIPDSWGLSAGLQGRFFRQ